jgi:hypothetical protein
MITTVQDISDALYRQVIVVTPFESVQSPHRETIVEFVFDVDCHRREFVQTLDLCRQTLHILDHDVPTVLA